MCIQIAGALCHNTMLSVTHMCKYFRAFSGKEGWVIVSLSPCCIGRVSEILYTRWIVRFLGRGLIENKIHTVEEGKVGKIAAV